MENNNQSNYVNQDGKLVALISYITIIGWLVAFFMHSNKRSSLGIYHLRQTLLIHVLSICISAGNFVFAFIPFIGWILNAFFMLAGVILFILWLLGLIYAANGEEKPIPLIGEQAQVMFGRIN